MADIQKAVKHANRRLKQLGKDNAIAIPSPVKNKKIRVITTDKPSGLALAHIDIGQKDSVTFAEKKDKKKQNSYLKRSAEIRNKQGIKTANKPWSANYLARELLWK